MSSSLSRSGALPPQPRAVPVAPAHGPTVASAVPLIIAWSAVLVSLVIAVVVLMTSSAAVVILGVPLPLVTPDAWVLSFAGYVLTPVVVIACYGWNAIAQRNGLRANRNFALRPGYSRALAWAAGVGIVLGAWHVLNLSVPLTDWLKLS